MSSPTATASRRDRLRARYADATLPLALACAAMSGMRLYAMAWPDPNAVAFVPSMLPELALPAVAAWLTGTVIVRLDSLQRLLDDCFDRYS